MNATRSTPERPLRRLQRALDAIFDVNQARTRTARAINIGLACLIVANVLDATIETVPTLPARLRHVLWWFETASLATFTIEYLARVWACVARPQYAHPFLGRLRYMLTPLALIDLLVILPSYLAFVTVDLRTLRLLRLLRVLRVLRIARYSESVSLMGRVLIAKRGELLTTLTTALVLLLIAATLMYHAEHEAQPANFGSIPACMWWAAVTLTTVGYGDMVPATPLGKFLATIVALLGIGLLAMPAGILGSGFVDALRKPQNVTCPHCGKPHSTS